MARSRPNLEKAINDILTRHGVDGKRLSLRQAERLTGLAPATIGELAKGNARTAETVRRFAQGFGEDGNRLLLLAGFTSEDAPSPQPPAAYGKPAISTISSSPISVSLNTIPSIGHSLDENNENFQNNISLNEISPNAAFIESFLSDLTGEEIALLHRLGNALKRLPSDSDRALWQAYLHHTAEMLERFAILESPPET